jgi:hypothetical protein
MPLEAQYSDRCFLNLFYYSNYERLMMRLINIYIYHAMTTIHQRTNNVKRYENKDNA